MEYTTSTGIKYGVGSTFHDKNNSHTFKVLKSGREGYLAYQNLESNACYLLPLEQINDYFLSGWWILDKIVSEDYKLVDPKSIKYNFKDKKIKINNPDEVKWLVEAYNENTIKPKVNITAILDGNYLFFYSITITYSNDEDTFNNSYFTEITIQDILNAQPMKAEIVGYELLKDLPGIPAYTKSSPYVGKGRGGVLFEYNSKIYSASDNELADTSWFKPIYKVADQLLKLSNNREAKVTKQGIGIYNTLSKSNIPIGTMDTKTLIKIFTDFGMINKKVYEGMEVYPLTLKVGCQDFNEKDMEDIFNAVQELSK